MAMSMSATVLLSLSLCCTLTQCWLLSTELQCMGAAMPLLANGCYITHMLKDDIIQWVNSNGGVNVYHYHSSHIWIM